MVKFAESVTKDNLMRAFAGESQARNRYTFAASQAKKNGFSGKGACGNFLQSFKGFGRKHHYRGRRLSCGHLG